MPCDGSAAGDESARKLTHQEFGKLTVFPAREIITMCEAMPTATAVAVGGGKIVAVGTMDTLQPWLDRYEYDVDDRMKDKVLMPGFIDPHVHPSLPAVLTQYPFLAPTTGRFRPASSPARELRSPTWPRSTNWLRPTRTGRCRSSRGATIRCGTDT
ncbi:amidohydrolase family protein [Mycobacterium kansasii]|uniref:Amidohydrolase family protein n=1 Tax=Mycobacterium kansasii TaxID=1768 RepID=A0A1V3XK03_MYCKA|nr:amidohydrolase family protein [Mycobacterium kansasii]